MRLAAPSAGGECWRSRDLWSDGFFLRTPFARRGRSRTPRAEPGRHARRGSVPRAQLLALRGARVARAYARSAKSVRAMAPQLWMLRHGEAVPHDSKPDHDRELTPRGRRQADAAGRALARARRGVRRLLHEPEGARAGRPPSWPASALERRAGREDALANGFSRVDALTLLDAHDDDARILVVGHEPSFSQVVYDFTGGRVDFKKGGVVACARRAAPASCWCCCARASSRRSRRGTSQAASAAGDHGQRDLGARLQRRFEHELLGVVRLAAARAEAVDRERDGGGEVAGVGRAAAGARRRSGGRARSLARSSSGAVAASECMPGQRRISSASRRTPLVLGGDVRRARASIASRSSARTSQKSSPWPGTTLNASPERRIVGTAVRCAGPSGAWRGGDGLGGRGQRQQRVAPAVGRGAGVGGAAVRGDVDRARRLAAHDDALVAAAQLAGLEAQARVEAREALDVAEVGAVAPLLVADEQQRELGVRSGARRTRAARRARARRRPSCRPRRSRRAARPRGRAAGARRGRRRCRCGRPAGPAACRCRVRRATRSSAWPGLEHGTRSTSPRRAQRGAQRGALLGAVHVAGRRRDGHERLELARRAARDLGRSLLDPRIHAVARLLTWTACPSCPRWRSPPVASPRRCRGRRSSRSSRRASTSSRRSTRR